MRKLPLLPGRQQNHCLDMRFYGSAMRMPHVQGAFRELLVADAAQAVRGAAPRCLPPRRRWRNRSPCACMR